MTDDSRLMEMEFRRFFIDRSLLATRLAIGVGFVLVAAICIMDLFLLPQALKERVVPLRILMMLIPIAAALGAMFLVEERLWLPRIVAGASLLVGISTVLATNMAAESGMPMAMWGTVFTTFFVYLVLGLNLRQSMAAGWLIFLAYLGIGIALGLPLQELAYGSLLLGVSNLVGTAASFLLERNARELFNSKREIMRLAHTDGLTGLFNRRTFDDHLRQVWKQARRDDKHIAVVVADIDYFKLYNDCYGHRKGDECIKAVADVLAASVSRPLDMVARYGGEEYVIVLYDPTASFLESFTRSLCHKIIDLDIKHKASETTPSVSLSIGAAITEASGNLTADQLIRQADDALYEAKNQGRNQAIVYRTEWGQQTTANLAAVLL